MSLIAAHVRTPGGAPAARGLPAGPWPDPGAGSPAVPPPPLRVAQRAVERVDLDAGVVRDRRDAGEGGHGACLQRGVLHVAVAGLLDDRPLPGVVLRRDPPDRPVIGDDEDLADLAGIARSDGEVLREP